MEFCDLIWTQFLVSVESRDKEEEWVKNSSSDCISRLNYWEKSFRSCNDASYDLTLLRERLQLLHIIHCYPRRGNYINSHHLLSVLTWPPCKLYNNSLMVFSIMKMLCKNSSAPFIRAKHSCRWRSEEENSEFLKPSAFREPTQRDLQTNNKEKTKVMLACVLCAVSLRVPKMSIEIKLSREINI